MNETPTTHHLAITDPNLRMTSIEIAQLTEKNHQHIMRDIRDLIDQKAIDQSSSGQISYLDQMNRTQPAYSLDFEASMVLVTGYDARRRSAVIKRWLALERGEATPAAYLGSSAMEAMAAQIIQMVVPAVISQVMQQIQPMVSGIQEKIGKLQINFSHAGTVWSFAYHCCQEGNSNTFVPKDELYAAYRAYCATIPYCRAEGKTAFLTKLYRAFLNTHSAEIRMAGEKVKAVRGIALLPGYMEIIEDKRRERQGKDAAELARRREWLNGIVPRAQGDDMETQS